MDSQWSYTSLMTDNLPEPYSNLAPQSENIEEEEEITTPIAQRDKNYSKEEDVILVSAWLNTSKNAIRGNEQKSGRFWERIMLYIQDNGGTRRTIKSLKNRWTEINTCVSRFVSCHLHIENRHESGKSAQQRLVDTHESYTQKAKGKTFKFEHCWVILKNEEKWKQQMPDDNKKPKNSSNSSPATPDTVNLEDEGEASARPQGRKAAKRQAQNKTGKEGMEETASSLVLKNYLEKRAHEHNAELEAHQITLEAHREQREIEQRALTTREREIEVQQEHEDNEVMKVDTRGMDEISASYFQNKKMEIMRKRGWM